MSKFGYEDFTYTSEEEMDEDPINDLSMNDDADGSSDDASDDGSLSDDTTDWDEYANFKTDKEKYDYDLAKWNGIPNARQYQKKAKDGAKKNSKGNAQEGAKQVTKSENQGNRKDLDKPTRKRKRKEQAPMKERTVHIPKDGEIHFDTAGALWYSYQKEGIYISERATFHHWIRPALCLDENAKGNYDFARSRGPGSFDITCFNEIQQHWGLQRRHYAPIMFEWERLDRKDPDYQLGSLYYQGLLVLDYWRTPVRHFREIPLVISSAFEGGYMEPATRLHSEMKYEDIRARMPPFIKVIKDGVLNVTPLSKSGTFTERARHFRENAGAIAWDQKKGSKNIKSFIENIVKPLNNSTRASRDLTKHEVNQLRLRNFGSNPRRAKPGTTKGDPNPESKERYKANTRRAAGLNPVEDEDDDKQEMELEDEEMTAAEDGNLREPTNEGWEMDDEDDYDQLTAGQESVAASPRMLFRCEALPILRGMTKEEALIHPAVDRSDPRNHVPKFQHEVDAIRDALQVTIDHFKEIFGFEPIVDEGGNYITRYCDIQVQMDEFLGDDATALRRLGRWEGPIFHWDMAEVEDDPCVGRRRSPFFF